jgi:hypothetical protein
MARRAISPPDPAAGRVRPGQRVRVHVNLHNGLIAVADPSTRTVLGYAHDITLAGVTFRVPPGGLAATRTAKCRRVFAYAAGQVTSIDAHPDLAGRPKISLTGNPFTDDAFMCGGQPVRAAAEVTFADRAGWLPVPARGNGPGEGLAAAAVSPGQVPEGAYVLHGGKRWWAGRPSPARTGRSGFGCAARGPGPPRRPAPAGCPATWSASTPIRAPAAPAGSRWPPGLDEEAHSLRTVPGGRYFCPASDDALHHPGEAA